MGRFLEGGGFLVLLILLVMDLWYCVSVPLMARCIMMGLTAVALRSLHHNSVNDRLSFLTR